MVRQKWKTWIGREFGVMEPMRKSEDQTDEAIEIEKQLE